MQLPALCKRLTVLISQEIEKLRPKYKLNTGILALSLVNIESSVSFTDM